MKTLLFTFLFTLSAVAQSTSISPNLPPYPGDVTKFLNGIGLFSVPAGSSGGGGSGSTNWVDSVVTNASLKGTSFSYKSIVTNSISLGTNPTTTAFINFGTNNTVQMSSAPQGVSTNININWVHGATINDDNSFNEVTMWGPNITAGGGAEISTETAIALALEGNYHAGGHRYNEAHLHFIDKTGVQRRPWSWRIDKDVLDWQNLIHASAVQIFDPTNQLGAFWSIIPTQETFLPYYVSGTPTKGWALSDDGSQFTVSAVGGAHNLDFVGWTLYQLGSTTLYGNGTIVAGAAIYGTAITATSGTGDAQLVPGSSPGSGYLIIHSADAAIRGLIGNSATDFPIDLRNNSDFIVKEINTERFRLAHGSGNLTGTGSIALPSAVFTNSVTTTLTATIAAAPTVASASTIAPTKSISFVSGTTAIDTITAPSPISATGGQITLIPTGLWSTTTSGNIALSINAVVGQGITFSYDATTTKWYPSLITPTTALNATYYPYTATTRVVGAGDSLMSGANNGTNGTILTYYNNFASSSSGGATNAARFGATIETIYTDYVTYVQPLKPASGTNALLLVYMGYNNIGQGTTNTAANVWAGISNYWNAARVDGFDVVGFTIPSSQGLVLSNELTRVTVNALMRHATNCTRLVDVDRLLLSSGNGPTADGLHWTTNYNCVIASNVFQVVTAPRQALRPESVMNLRRTERFKQCDGVDGTGCTRGASSTDFKFGRPTFSGTAARGGNYALYRWTVPYDLDVTQPFFASLGLVWNAADTGTQIYDIAISQLTSSGADPGPGAATTMTFSADSSGANGDYQHLGGINLPWSNQVIPGLDTYIIVTRQGDVDTSGQTSTALSLSIGYGVWP